METGDVRGCTSASGGTTMREMDYVVLVVRVFYATIFVMAGLGHFSAGEISYAAQQGVPTARLLVPLSGVIALAGGLSILLGYHARIGAWLLALFLVPVTVMMHNFCALTDPRMAQRQQVLFM